MHLDRMKTLSFTSVLALSLASGCSSNKNNDDDDNSLGTGGSGFQVQNTGGASSAGGGGTVSVPVDPNYCDGLLANAVCGQTSLQADIRQVNMLLVIDMSGSMKYKPTETATQTKWEQMKLALSTTLAQQAKFIDFGLELFPYSGDPSAPGVGDGSDPVISCNVPSGSDPNVAIAVGVAPGIDHFKNDILPVLQSSTPAGGTPTTKALQQAYAYFVDGAGRDLNGTKWVLLATDGGPNCNAGLSCGIETCTQNIDCLCGNGCNATMNCCESSATQSYGYICLDNEAVVDQIAKLANAGIKTFVVGVPGTEQYTATLNAMAQAGGKPKENDPKGDSYYAVSAANSLQDLQDAFSVITTQLVKECDIPLTESPRDKSQVIVAIDCLRVPRVDDNTPEQGGADGYWVDYETYAPGPAHLRVTGTYCSRLQTQGAEHLDVITGCQPIN